MRVHLSSLVAAAGVILALHIAPSSAYAQAKTSVCKDGTSSVVTGRGACTGHGGVDAAKTQAATKAAAKPAAKPATTAAKSAPKDAPKMAGKPAPNPPAATVAEVKTDDKDATGATAQCKDGTYSHAAGHKGACSKHGGVAKFLK